MASQDYYQILGISKTATPDEIKKAYRKLALQYHPDRNKTQAAGEKFKEVTKAYEVLGDPGKRQTYDQFGAAAFDSTQSSGPFGQGGPFGGGQQGRYGPFTYSYSTGSDASGFDFGGFSDPFEIFEQFFGGANPFGRAERKPVYSLSISFMDAVKGTTKKVTIDGRSQTIKIPKGVDNGSRIRFQNYDVVVEVQSDRRFQREGYDIVSTSEISFVDAILGGEVPVETAYGEVKVKIPQGTQSDTVIRLSGKGVSHVRGGGQGNHYVRIKVLIPNQVTSEQKELLKNFGEIKNRKRWF